MPCFNDWLNSQGFGCVSADTSTFILFSLVAKMCKHRALDGVAAEFSMKSDANSQFTLWKFRRFDLVMCHKDSTVYIDEFRRTAFSPHCAKKICACAPNEYVKFVGMFFDDINIRALCQSNYCPNLRLHFVDDIVHTSLEPSSNNNEPSPECKCDTHSIKNKQQFELEYDPCQVLPPVLPTFPGAPTPICFRIDMPSGINSAALSGSASEKKYMTRSPLPLY